MKKLVLLLVLVSGLAYAQTEPWRQNYEKGLQYVAQGKYEDAAAYLKMAVADKPISEIIQDGKETLEYLPYLQLGICYSRLGKPELASEYFELESTLEPIKHSSNGMALMKQYQAGMKSSENKEIPKADQSIRAFSRKPYLLSDLEVNKMKEGIRKSCNLPVAADESYPWYFHYELGKAFENKQDWQRALDSFLLALDHRDQPKRGSRTYGMWFIDYYPYYNIGLAHFRLSNWKCADDAFKLSQMFEDLPADSEQSRQLQEMKAEAEQKIIAGDGSKE